MGVAVTKVDDKNKQIIVTFEADKKVWKSVPFSKLGSKDCPLQKLEERSKATKHTTENGAAEREGSKTPDWWEDEKKKMKKRPTADEIKQQEKSRAREEAKLR